MQGAFVVLGLNAASLCTDDRKPTPRGQLLMEYFAYRAQSLNSVKNLLMDVNAAKNLFEKIMRKGKHVCPLPLNKQKGEKKTYAYLTCMVTMLLEETLEDLSPMKMSAPPKADESDALTNWLTRSDVERLLGAKTYVDKLITDGHLRTARRNCGRSRPTVYHPADVQRLKPHCNYDPRTLTTVTADGQPVRTLARRIDGAFPNVVNPIAIWEIKEYYYTTTFGSRVADGVYETLLDGAELEELRSIGRHVRHYLIVDGFKTWWDDGKSYLCRIIDALHMRYVDEVLFGREVLTRIPEIAKEWITEQKVRQSQAATASSAHKQEPGPVISA